MLLGNKNNDNEGREALLASQDPQGEEGMSSPSPSHHRRANSDDGSDRPRLLSSSVGSSQGPNPPLHASGDDDDLERTPAQTYHPNMDNGKLANMALEVSRLRTFSLDSGLPMKQRQRAGWASRGTWLSALENVGNDSEDDDERTMLEEGDDIPRSSLLHTRLAILKSFVGPAVLFLPAGFQQGGWLLSILALIMGSMLCMFGSWRLILCWRLIGGSYGRLAAKTLGRKGLVMVRFAMTLVQCAISLTYFIFIANNLQDVFKRDLDVHVQISVLVFVQAGLQLPMAFVRHVQQLSFAAIIADVCILFGLIAITVSCVDRLASDGTTHIDMLNGDRFLLMVGTSMFVFEGFALLIPLQEAVELEKQDEFLKVYCQTVLMVGVLYIGFPLMCRLAFGPDVDTVLTVSLPDGALKTIIQLAYSLAVYFTFPLMLYPGHAILERAMNVMKIIPRVAKSDMSYFEIRGNIMRVIVVLILAVIALVEHENLDHLVSLSGGAFGIPLMCVFPALMHLKAAPDAPTWSKVLDYSMCVVGVVCIGLSLFITLTTWSDE